MTEPASASLSDLAAKLEAQVNGVRRTHDHAALIAAANAAADEIEHRVGEDRGTVEREVLRSVRRFTFNAAADCWPGWTDSGAPPDTRNLSGGLALARRSADLTVSLGLGRIQEGTGIWLIGAFELALGRYTEAAGTFESAREHYNAANAPGLALLTEGYSAIVRRSAGGPDDLDDVCARIAAGAFEDGPEWIEQLRTARKVFAR
jgi:hypothetical protein